MHAHYHGDDVRDTTKRNKCREIMYKTTDVLERRSKTGDRLTPRDKYKTTKEKWFVYMSEVLNARGNRRG